MRLVQAGDRYVLYSEYKEREHPKRAGFRWDAEKKVWYTTEQEKAARLASAADDELKARLLGLSEHFTASVEASRAIDADIYIPSPDGLNYLNYQRAGVQYAVDRWMIAKREGWGICGVLFGDDMGLGKTIQGIGWINADEEIKRILVISPASLKLNWYKELRKWLVRERPIAVVGDKFPYNFDVVITNYDQLKKWELPLRRQTWDLMILDEAHYIKNPDTQRAQYIIGRKERKEAKRGKDGQITTTVKPAISPIPARRIAALTGTPINNKPEELWTIAHLLDPRTFKDKWEYLGRYCGREKTQFGWKTDGASNLNELQTKLRSTIMVRRLKKDVLTELPPKRRQVIEMSPDQDASIRALVSEEVEAFQRHEDTLEALRAAVEIAKASDDVEEYRNAVRALREGLSASFSEMARLRKETALAKVPYVIGHLKDCLENGKVVCFAHHREVIDKIVAAFPGRVVKIDGRDSITARDLAVTRFQTDPKIDLFVGQIQAAGVGLTLVASSHVVFCELDWVPASLSQAEDRCILEGQKVLTVGGWTPIEKVEIGDLVIGHDGLPHAVTDKWSRQARGVNAASNKTIAEISLRGWNENLNVTTDHQILTTMGWVEADKIRPGDEICMPGRVPGAEVEYIAFPEELRTPESYVTPESAARESSGRPKPESEQRNGRMIPAPGRIYLTADAMFTFGYYLGDGFASTRPGKGRFVSFAGNKGNKVERIAVCSRWAQSVGASYSVYPDKDSQGTEMRVFSADWARWFENNFGRVLEEKRIPEWVFSLSEDQRAAFLNGMLCSDGYQRLSNGGRGSMRHDFITVNARLAADACRLMMGLGLKPCVFTGSTNQTSVQFTQGMPTTLKVSSINFRNPSKTERVYDITVDGAASFVVGTAVVHNCHRIGQHDSVLAQHIVLEGSLDAKMATKLVAKQEVIDLALDVDAKEMGQEVVLPWEDKHATAGSTRASIAKEAVLITMFEIEAVQRALRQLAGMCDGARREDGAGFNKLDAQLGKDLASRAHLTAKQAALGRRIATKYKRQLGEDLVAEMWGNKVEENAAA